MGLSEHKYLTSWWSIIIFPTKMAICFWHDHVNDDDESPHVFADHFTMVSGENLAKPMLEQSIDTHPSSPSPVFLF